MLDIAIIGAGRIGAVHAATIAAHPAARLTVVCDADPAAAQALAERYGARPVTTAQEVFDAADVAAVVVGSPTPFHVEHVLGAVDAGHAVLCEKPVDLDLARTDALLAAIAGREHRVMVGFNRRFDPSFAEVQARLAAGEIGAVEQVIIVSRDPAPPPAAYLAGSGGLFRDMTIHDLDLARFLLGDIVSVHAAGQCTDPAVGAAGDLDGAVLTLVAASGALATIVNSRHSATGYDQRLEVFGPLGTLRATNPRATSVEHDGAGFAGARGPYLDFFLDRYAEAYRRELDHFVTAVTSGTAPTPSARDGREALVLAEAAARSLVTGAAVPVAPPVQPVPEEMR